MFGMTTSTETTNLVGALVGNKYRIVKEIGRGGDFNNLTEYDLTALMTPGTHALAIEGFNDAATAGVMLKGRR